MNNSTSIFEKTLNILESTGTNYSVEKKPLYFAEGGIANGVYGIQRSDDKRCLGHVGERYSTYQNSTLVEQLVQATSMLDLEISKGGTMKDGALVYYQMALPDEFIGKSSIKRNISALNSHDGSSSIGFGSSNTVVICQNTFFKAHRDLGKVKHTASAFDRVQVLADNLRNTIQNDLLLMDNFKRMADMPMQDEIVERVIRKLFELDPSMPKADISTRKLNQVTAFADSLRTEIDLEGKTIWGLFNGVTRYTNHVGAPKNADAKTEYLMQGTGMKMSNMAYDELMAWVLSNTAQTFVAV